MAKSNEQKAKAKSLYCTGQYSQKEIAALTGISEKTIGKWKEDDKWDEFKISLLTTRENELRRLYKMLQNLNDFIEELASNKVPINSKLADAVLKLTTAIKNLEIETSIAEKVEVGTDFINMVRKEDVELSKVITKWFDVYLKSTMK